MSKNESGGSWVARFGGGEEPGAELLHEARMSVRFEAGVRTVNDVVRRLRAIGFRVVMGEEPPVLVLSVFGRPAHRELVRACFAGEHGFFARGLEALEVAASSPKAFDAVLSAEVASGDEPCMRCRASVAQGGSRCPEHEHVELVKGVLRVTRASSTEDAMILARRCDALRAEGLTVETETEHPNGLTVRVLGPESMREKARSIFGGEMSIDGPNPVLEAAALFNAESEEAGLSRFECSFDELDEPELVRVTAMLGCRVKVERDHEKQRATILLFGPASLKPAAAILERMERGVGVGGVGAEGAMSNLASLFERGSGTSAEWMSALNDPRWPAPDERRTVGLSVEIAGLPGSGKTRLAVLIERALKAYGASVRVADDAAELARWRSIVPDPSMHETPPPEMRTLADTHVTITTRVDAPCTKREEDCGDPRCDTHHAECSREHGECWHDVGQCRRRERETILRVAAEGGPAEPILARLEEKVTRIVEEGAKKIAANETPEAKLNRLGREWLSAMKVVEALDRELGELAGVAAATKRPLVEAIREAVAEDADPVISDDTIATIIGLVLARGTR